MGHNFGQKDALLVGVVETRPCGRLFNDSESNRYLDVRLRNVAEISGISQGVQLEGEDKVSCWMRLGENTNRNHSRRCGESCFLNQLTLKSPYSLASC